MIDIFVMLQPAAASITATTCFCKASSSEFKMRGNQRGSGKRELQWKGGFMGDRLTDNIADRDGERFNDVYEFSERAVLH